MYYADGAGNLRTIRSSSQLESLHRFLYESLPGTHMSLEGAEMAVIDFCFRYAHLLAVASYSPVLSMPSPPWLPCAGLVAVAAPSC